MNALQEKFTYFKQKQAEITELYNQVEPRKQALVKEFDSKAADLKAEYTAKIDEIDRPLAAMKEKYKAELKAFAGITDGESLNVLDTLIAIQRLLAAQ